MAKYSVGLDYGTNSVRAMIVNVASGREAGASVWMYKHGKDGIILSDDPNLARQHPADYVKGAETTIKRAVAAAKRKIKGFSPKDIIGIGVDTTGSTPLPTDRTGKPLALLAKFSKNPAAMAWLWKDHTSVAEAEEITEYAKRHRPHYLDKCGGAYSSEWFFSKILHCLRTSPKVFDAAHSWVEIADWIPAMLTGTESPADLAVGVCAAGHKAMYNQQWGGYPDVRFLSGLNPKLERLHKTLRTKALTSDQSVGGLTKHWAKRTGLAPGTAVAAGAFDAHLGAVGAGIKPDTLVKIIGTSACDMLVVPAKTKLTNIPGLCGVVNGSILPGHTGIEAGQSAVGDIFNWFVNYIQPGGPKHGTHRALTAEAKKMKPGASGLLALDWNNGNRSILCDYRLTGLLLGQSLHTTPGEIYRALIEATAFGALTIINRLEEHNIKVRQIVACGGIAEKNPLVMQIYADVTGRTIKLSSSSQTCALGAAVAGSVAAGKKAGGHETFEQAQKAMTALKTKVYKPHSAAAAVYKKLYVLYHRLHDTFGTTTWHGNCHNVMKQLLEIRRQARG